MASEIGGRRDEHELLAREAARDQRRIGQVAGADREVEAVLDEVGMRIGQARIERQLGMALEKAASTGSADLMRDTGSDRGC
jgi:hypothetical protein